MKNSTSRRLFLRNTAIASTGLAFISSNVASSFASVAPYDGYNPFAEETNDLRSNLFGKHVSVKGRVFEKSTMLPLANSLVEVWHLSPDSGKFRHRAKIRTNANGEYSFKTDFPAKETGKNARIFFKVSDGNKSTFTELLLGTNGEYITSKHWEENQHLGDDVFPKTKNNFGIKTTIFNLSI